MSQENVERVRRAYALFNSGEADEWLDMFGPDVVFTLSGVFPDFDPEYRGRDGLRRFRETLLEAWEFFRAEPRELVDRGDVVGAILDLHAKGRGSGAEVRLTFHHAFHFRDGLADRWTSFPTLDEAIEAAEASQS